LLEAILSPHEFEQAPRITITGSDAALSGKALTSFALLVHELATNAAKYGALSTPEGRLAVEISVTRDETLRVGWEEQAAAHAIGNQDRDREGFGTALEKAVLVGLDGSISRDWREEGLSLTIEMPLARLVQ
jgi:two-component sensor histidine kinase